ncbi:MAG: cell division protein FtsZ [Methanoregula sp.]
MSDPLKNGTKTLQDFGVGTVEEPAVGTPRFVVIGCGGAGCSIVDRVAGFGFGAVTTIAIDTDREDLRFTHAGRKILLGNGLYRGWREGDPRESALALSGIQEEMGSFLRPDDVVLVVAGLGGGAGSGTAPVIAEIAKKKGAFVLGIISLSFAIQQKWINQGMESLANLLRHSESVIVIDNEQFRQRYQNEPVPVAYEKADELMLGVIRGLVTVLTEPCLIECPPDDFYALFRNRGLAMVLDGESVICPERPEDSVVRRCWSSPSLDIDFRKATGCFILITAGIDICLCDTEQIATSLTYELDPHADVVWSAMVERPLEGRVRVFAIMTGIPQEGRNIHFYKFLPGSDR